MRARLLLLPLLVLAACKSKVNVSDEGFGPDPQTGAMPAEADRYAIHSRGGELKLGLTDEAVYYRLSDKMLADIDRQLQQDSARRGGLGGAIAGAVSSGVSKLLRHRIQYALDDIRDIRYEDGRVTFEFMDGTTQTPKIDTKTSSGPGRGTRTQEPAFAPDDLARFIEAFQAARHGPAS